MSDPSKSGSPSYQFYVAANDGGASPRERDYIGLSEASAPGEKPPRAGDPPGRLPDLNLGLRLGPLPEIKPLDLDQSRASFQNYEVSPHGREDSQAMQSADASGNAPSSSPVVGWPPVQSFRNKALAMHPQPKPNESQGLPSAATSPATPLKGTLFNSFFVKVYMDGVAIGRKVDLNSSNSYERLSSLLEEMFLHFILDKSRAKKSNPGNIALVKDDKERKFTHGADYVLAYEDKDGDLMLVGDVPWSMFIHTVKRLRIMKGSDAIGLAPKDLESGNTPPIKEIALTGAFLVLGSLGVIVGAIMIHYKVGGDRAHGIAFTVLGAVLIMPVPYYARNAYYAYKGYKGFSLAESSTQ